MADLIYLVQGDTPSVRVNLTREDTGSAINVTAATVYLHFRSKGNTTLLFSVTGESTAQQATDGVVIFNFTAVQTDLSTGNYEAEVEIVYDDGSRETVFEILDFFLREDFA